MSMVLDVIRTIGFNTLVRILLNLVIPTVVSPIVNEATLRRVVHDGSKLTRKKHTIIDVLLFMLSIGNVT